MSRILVPHDLTPPSNAALEAARNATSIAPYLEHIKANRPKTVSLLAHAVDWTRLGNWRGTGRRTLKQLAEALVAHDADHIAQIQALKAAQTAGIQA